MARKHQNISGTEIKAPRSGYLLEEQKNGRTQVVETRRRIELDCLSLNLHQEKKERNGRKETELTEREGKSFL